MNMLYIIPLAALALFPIIRDHLHQRRRQKMDEILPIALLELSTLPIHSLRDVINYLSDRYGPISEVFRKAQRISDKGIPPDRAIRSAAARTTPLLEHAVEIIIVGYNSGVRWNQIVRKTAEDIEAVVDMERQRRASLALQRYNVLLSSGVFVPALLGISTKMADKIASGTWNPLIGAIKESIVPYIIILAVESAVFLAVLDGRMHSAIYYSAVLSALGLASYVVAMSM